MVEFEDPSINDASASPTQSCVLFWDSFDTGQIPNGISVPRFVIDNSEHFLRKYNHEIDALGQLVLSNSHFNSLQLRQDFNYWWMSIPAIASLEQNSAVYVAIRLLALEVLIRDRCNSSVLQITLEGGSQQERAPIVSWLRLMGVSVNSPKDRGSQIRRSAQQVRRFLSVARVWIDFVIAGAVKGRQGKRPIASGNSVTIVNYLKNLSAQKGYSSFSPWQTIYGAIDEQGADVRWLHMSADYANWRILTRDRATLRALSQTSGNHSLVHDYACFRLAWRALLDYVRVCRTRNDVRLLLDANPIGSSLKSSADELFFGRSTMLNCLWLNLFEEAFQESEGNVLCLYFYENQPWETALVSSWRRTTRAPIAGFGAATMLTWDTRYNKSWTSDLLKPLLGPPQPDVVLVNGPLMLQQARDFGIPERKIRGVETLSSRSSVSSCNKKSGGNREAVRGSFDICLFGEYDHKIDRLMIQMLRNFQEMNRQQLRICYRPHPTNGSNCVVVPPNWQLSRHPSIEAAFDETRIAVCGPISSAALNAYQFGLPVIVIADPASPLASPIQDFVDVGIALGSDDIHQKLEALLELQVKPSNTRDVFHEGGDTRWRHFLMEHIRKQVSEPQI